MKVLVLKRPDQPELENPYFAALDGDEYRIVEEKYKEEDYPPFLFMTDRLDLAGRLAFLINTNQIDLEDLPNNPANLRPTQVGIAEGYRLLCKHEIGDNMRRNLEEALPNLPEVEMWIEDRWVPGKTGGNAECSYRTKLSMEQLYAKRFLRAS